MFKSTQAITKDENEVKDKYFLCYILFYTLGTMTMVPNNFFTTANDYWMYKFRDPSVPWNASADKTDLQSEFTSAFSITSSVTGVVSIAATIMMAKRLPIEGRLIGTLTIVATFFLFTVTFVKIDTDSWQSGFFGLSIIFCIFMNAASASFMVTLFQLIARFPIRYMASILSGQSICGIFAALIQIIALSFGADSQNTALIYFLVGFFCVVTALAYYLYNKYYSDFYIYHTTKPSDFARPNFSREQVKKLFYDLRFYLLCMIIVLGSSIMIHPGVTSLVESENKGSGNKWNDVFFKPVCTFLLYNVFDFIGREAAGIIARPTNSLVMLAIAVVRVSLLPMLMFCNAQPRHHTEAAFHSDALYIVLILLLSFSNGYMVNLCIIQIPSVVQKEDKLLSSLIIAVTLVGSLGICSFLNVLMVKAL